MKTIIRLVVVTGVFVALTSCGGGRGGGSASSTSNNLVATAIVGTAPADTCPNGGITVNGGIDSNGNKVLDPSEVTSTQYVCNGTDGSNGLTTLVLITAEAAGANCATGGNKVEAGRDTNINQALDAVEVSSTAYICSGTDGSSGNNGFNSLVSIVPEAGGQYCTYGGNKVSSGLDNNPTNGALDPAEITSSSYVCNGAPGQPIQWFNVTDTTVQAESNTGYMTNNAAQVTVTLPASPAVGDIVQVTGLGSGGWKIAQNAGQNVITQNLIPLTARVSDANRYWQSIAVSADGTKQVAVAYGGPIYSSADSGVTWTARASNLNWYSVASSADGTKMVAVVYGGQIYTSSNSGQTWAPPNIYLPARYWVSVASSADGTKLVAVVEGGQIYTSTDSGVNWTVRETNRNWWSVASSADGNKLVAAATGGYIYTSTDSGVTWTERTPNPGGGWTYVASSADGSKLAAAVWGGRIYTSTDSGVIWSARESIRSWSSVHSSADGTRLMAADAEGQLHTSTDSGVAWTAWATPRYWYSVAFSDDGTRVTAVTYQGYIYSSIVSTRTGTSGSISGGQYDAIALQYIGNNTFTVLSHEGYLTVQ